MDELVLSYNGTPLNDDQTVEQFGLVSGSTLDATVKLFGGKVHGSLARAGKVKGQTPKVISNSFLLNKINSFFLNFF
jgi:small subunit ribosomal protein S30e